jgi:hypothetical protein
MRRLAVLALGLLLVSYSTAPGGRRGPAAPARPPKAVTDAREQGLDWLTTHQAADGSWGKTYSVAVTGFACLAYLSATDEPYTGDRGRALLKGLRFLLDHQKDGTFAQQGHTWIHGQGFGTLALAEAYGRSLFCKTKPDIDTRKIRTAVAAAVRAIAKNQSSSGGWWYTPGSPELHEGSTTVCAVQAIVAAANFGIPVDERVLDRGFAYLKKCQNAEGAFEYKLGDGSSMKEGSAADVATLGLMKKFDFTVMVKGYNFLLKITPGTISNGSFPYYGHYYGCMGMHLLGQEYQEDRQYREKTAGYIAGVHKELLAWRQKDGSWPLKGWVAQSNNEDAAYATAFATLTLGVTEARLSVYRRTPPKLPREARKG